MWCFSANWNLTTDTMSLFKPAHELLGVAANAYEDEVKAAYKNLALKIHPDKNPDRVKEATVHFQQIQKAYQTMLERCLPRPDVAPSNGKWIWTSNGLKWERTSLSRASEPEPPPPPKAPDSPPPYRQPRASDSRFKVGPRCPRCTHCAPSTKPRPRRNHEPSPSPHSYTKHSEQRHEAHSAGTPSRSPSSSTSRSPSPFTSPFTSEQVNKCRQRLVIKQRKCIKCVCGGFFMT